MIHHRDTESAEEGNLSLQIGNLSLVISEIAKSQTTNLQ